MLPDRRRCRARSFLHLPDTVNGAVEIAPELRVLVNLRLSGFRHVLTTPTDDALAHVLRKLTGLILDTRHLGERLMNSTLSGIEVIDSGLVLPVLPPLVTVIRHAISASKVLDTVLAEEGVMHRGVGRVLRIVRRVQATISTHHRVARPSIRWPWFFHHRSVLRLITIQRCLILDMLDLVTDQTSDGVGLHVLVVDHNGSLEFARRIEVLRREGNPCGVVLLAVQFEFLVTRVGADPVSREFMILRNLVDRGPD